MADWKVVACLRQLFAEFDVVAPDRDHASDGSIGDSAHQHEVSDHNPDETGSVPIHDADKVNEVHAIDVDVDLRELGLTMEAVVQFVLARCRSGSEKRLRYIIYDRRIWQASNGWRQTPYSGASAHTEHAHFSASYDTAREASTASWHLEDIPVALTAADKQWITSQVVEAVAKAVWNHEEPDPEPAVSGSAVRRTGGDLRMLEKRRRDMEARLNAKIAEVEAKLDALQDKAA